jgi:hypothetical protein
MGQRANVMWNQDTEMEPAAEMSQNKPETTRDEPETHP